MVKVVAGIDIGGTNTRFGIVNEKGKIISKASILTGDYETIIDFASVLSSKIFEMLVTINNEQLTINNKKFNSSLHNTQYKLQGIGIGSPNGNFHKGTIENPTNLRWKGVFPFVEMMKKNMTKLSSEELPVFITNDAKAAAMGEMVYGAAKGMKDFVVITLGTGLGSGFVVNGEVMYGYSGFAGELGHTIIETEGRVCGCGRRGCLETYVSATGITNTVKEMLSTSKESSILRKHELQILNSKLIYEAALQGDKLALEAFDYTGKLLGIRLADTAAITSPEVIFLFGGLAEAGDFIFKPTQHYMDMYMLRHMKGTVKLLPSGIEQSNAAVLGASALAWHNIN